MSKKYINIIDPVLGWKYGFPKIFPSDVTDIKAWLIEQGLPENLTQYSYSFWRKELED